MKTLKPIYLMVFLLPLVVVAAALILPNYKLSAKTVSAAAVADVTNSSLAGSANQTPVSVNTATVNGITVEASNFRIKDGFFVVDVCYDRPTEADWLLPANTTLLTESNSITVFEWGMIEFKVSADGGPGQRCDFARFLLDASMEIKEFEISIPRLETSFPESLDCDAAQKKLDSSGIEIRCVQDEGYYGPELTSKPEALSDSDAYDLIGDAFIEIVDGPWILSGSMQ
jgi:hypothetical protein